MGAYKEAEAFRLTEPVFVEDDYCTGLALIEDLGDAARFVLYSRQTCFEGDGHPVLMVKRKIVMPYVGPEAMDGARHAVEMTTRFLARRAARHLAGKALQLVRA